MRIGFNSKPFIQPPTVESKKPLLVNLKGKKLLPDLQLAILASLRGYVCGSYPSVLSGAAKELGYYPLSEASAEELEKIQKIATEMLQNK